MLGAPAWADSLHAQVLSFNDYHGHLEVDEGATLTETQDPEQNLVGGVANLATTLNALRSDVYTDQSVTVAAGDLIGGSPFLSGIFHDEPSVDSLNAIGLDFSSVGNHEFDEGTEELLRMQNGGCHPTDGCGNGENYDGADFQWLAANVVERDSETGETLLPGTAVQNMGGVDVGFIGMTWKPRQPWSARLVFPPSSSAMRSKRRTKRPRSYRTRASSQSW
ncbi:hypothetical protein [Ornithinimicrobium sp. INDO-MA30-4]|uniref:hypothetical protein n=1 Tax=Ornithinimicrobium sp. INDO-MA30-4 TaxID=2908651 RepID=UPI001F1AF8BB|nr:hypothetical protein [Ornithinimicrobium sp. INDO-MA30-4]UJH69934.1 hypothetical protein L0A91_11970 [Ornithinimicrobium sp. INDO-MA30-4]